MIPGFEKKSVKFFWEEGVLPVMRLLFWDRRALKLPGMDKLFNSLEFFFKLAKVDFFRDNLPEFDAEKTETSWIPINKKIEGMDEVVLPEEILFRFIEKARHLVIVDWCACRMNCKCEKHSREVGCLMMGESALLIPEKSRKEVNVVAAKAHVRKAIQEGLVPVTGKFRVENDLFMIPDKGKLLTICFCCSCCCLTRFLRHIPTSRMNEMLRPGGTFH